VERVGANLGGFLGLVRIKHGLVNVLKNSHVQRALLCKKFTFCSKNEHAE
jgi:hypothetical protein